MNLITIKMKKKKKKKKKKMSKRDREDDSVGPVGPVGPSGPAAPPEKKRTEEFLDLHLSELPSQSRYEQSLEHADHVVRVAVSTRAAFVITASVDGRVKFWKKKTQGIEFVK